MTELLRAAQMRAIEQAAIDCGEVTGLELMERAGRGVVEAIFEEWPEYVSAPQTAVVLCGPGNNGGDGFVVARLLKECGWEVDVFCSGDPQKMPPDARVNFGRWLEHGPTIPLSRSALRRCRESAVYVDAIFGTGLSRNVEGELRAVLTQIGGSGGDGAYYKSRFVAIDAPSGLCLDSGRFLISGLYLPSSRLTVSFDSPKVGHFTGDGPHHCGRVQIVDIGLRSFRETQSIAPNQPGRDIRRPDTCLVRLEPLVQDRRYFVESLGFASLSKRGDAAGAHKYSHGHALILSGPSGQGGAARLSARGALRIGAGLVTIACPPSAMAENAARLDAVMLRALHGKSETDALIEVLEDDRINAVCLGPGLGLDRAKALVSVVLAERVSQGELTARGIVLDADALSCFAEAPDELFGLLHDRCVLTPHAGEFARLFPDISERLSAPAVTGPAYSKVEATREAAARAGCVVLFKGPDTVIADQHGRCSINSAHYGRAAPWLATAGSGDVLAGFIAGLLARGLLAMEAAETAAWLHVECALSFGPGLIAEDLPEELPRVFRALGA